MAFNIKSEECDRLARELAQLTGESVTDAVLNATAERLARERRARDQVGTAARRARPREIFARMRGAPVRDPRPDDDLLGYDADGLFD